MGTIEFWTGSSGVGKSHRMFNEIFEETERSPLGPYMYIITPTQNTLRYETELTTHALGGSLRTGVFSFNRFIWHVMNEVVFETKDTVSDHSQILLLFQIMNELNDAGRLEYFRDTANELDFSSKVLDMVKELNRYNVTPEMLEAVEYSHLSTQDKMRDVTLIYREWQSRTTELNIEDFNMNQHLIEILQRGESLQTIKDATIYIDGFHNFTESEMQLIVELSKHVKKVTILLLHLDVSRQPELFRKTNFVIERIREISGNIKVTVISEETHRANTPGLYQVEQQLLADKPITNYEGVSFIHAQNVNQEMTEIARQIEHLTYNEDAHFSEIAVLYRDSELLPALSASFERFNINYQFDLKIPMHRHPFIKFILALLDCYQNDLNQKSFINLLKLGFLTEKRDAPLIYTLENMILERGLTGTALRDDRYFGGTRMTSEDGETIYSFDNPETAACIDLKNNVLDTLDKLFESFGEALSARTFAEAIYAFLETEGIHESLNTSLELLLETDPRRHSETLQAYRLLMTLLDDFVRLFEDEQMDTDTLFTAFTEALLNSQFNLLPATIDQVTVGNMDLAKVENKKYVFLIGMTRDHMPSAARDTNVISDREKEDFAMYDIHFSPTSTELANDERFVFYHAVTRPTHRLYISWSDYGSNGELTKVSPFVTQLLPDKDQHALNYNYHRVADYHLEPSRLLSSLETVMPEVYAKLERLVGELKEARTMFSALPDTAGITQVNQQWLRILKLLKEESLKVHGYHAFNEVLRYLNHKNISQQLDHEVAENLYKTPMHASVSRFEMFNRCQFQHFANYGLKLNVRKPYTIESLDTGVLIHDALEMLYNESERKLSNIADDTLEATITDIVDRVAKKISFDIFERSTINQMIKKHTSERILNVARFLKAMEPLSGYETTEVELSFGMRDERFPALTLETPDNHEVNLRGKIDRLELFTDDDVAYVNIIDYKSSVRALNKQDVMMGVELQLLTYMYYVLTHYKSDEKLIPNSMLYYPVKKPQLSDSSDLLEDDNQALLFKELKPEGLFVANSQLLEDNDSLANMIKPNYRLAEFMPVQLSKGDSEIHGRSFNTRFVSTDVLKRYMDAVIENYKSVTDNIYRGHTKINPLEPRTSGGRLPCSMCDFRHACRIDHVMDRDLLRPYTADKETINAFEESGLGDQA